MDPKAAAMVLEVLRKMLKVGLDTSALENEAAKIDNRVKDMLGKAKAAHTQYKKVENEGSLGTMYG
jgi:predicted ATP-grasp superfamily ATP-dependent carboligase